MLEKIIKLNEYYDYTHYHQDDKGVRQGALKAYTVNVMFEESAYKNGMWCSVRKLFLYNSNIAFIYTLQNHISHGIDIKFLC